MDHRQYFADIYTQLDRFLKTLESELGNKESYAKELYDPLSHSLHTLATKRLKYFLSKWQSYSHNKKLVVFYNTISYIQPVFLSVCMVLRKIAAEYQQRPDDNTKHYLECAYQEQGSLYQDLETIFEALNGLKTNMPYDLKFQLVFMAPHLNITENNFVYRLQELQTHLKNTIKPSL